MSDVAETWVEEYLRLRRVQTDLREFLRRYNTILAQIARAHSEEAKEPCEHCEVQVTSLIDLPDGWYFEWQCGGDRYTQGRCSADTCGWTVSMDVVHAEVEAALAAAART